MKYPPLSPIAPVFKKIKGINFYQLRVNSRKGPLTNSKIIRPNPNFEKPTFFAKKTFQLIVTKYVSPLYSATICNQRSKELSKSIINPLRIIPPLEVNSRSFNTGGNPSKITRNPI